MAINIKISMFIKRLLHILSLYLEFRYCCVIISLDMFYLVFIFLFVSLYLSIAWRIKLIISSTHVNSHNAVIL